MSPRRLLCAGLDVGSAAVKVALVASAPDGDELIGGCTEQIRKREPLAVAESALQAALAAARLQRAQLDYVATTGEGEVVAFRTGHFYGMTAHARGGLFLEPAATAVLDVGALHARAMAIDARGKVLGYRMTNQCASGSGQFLQNICRYLGVTIGEIGQLSLQSRNPEPCSSICAVLAETDVINMVSRGVPIPDIVKGIHVSMAGRYAKLLAGLVPRGTVLMTGGLALDLGLVAALREALRDGEHLALAVHEHSPLAGAIGAAIWGAFRVRKLADRGLALARGERP
jgi:benzoyl-CoA reductase subunit D